MTTPDDKNDNKASLPSQSANGHWIKMFKALWDHPKVVSMCETLNCGEALVIGALYRLWSLADTHSIDGRLDLSAFALNRKVGVEGFAEAIANTGWLEMGAGFVVVVRFEEHNGQCAKRRAQDAVRAAKYRHTSHLSENITQPSRCERDATMTQSKSKSSEQQNHKTHESMKHESFRVSDSMGADGIGIRFGQIIPEHVQRIVRMRDGPLFESYFADAVRAGWAKDCDADRITMAALFHQVVRIGRAKHPGRVISRSWKNRDSQNPRQRLKLANVDEDFARALLKPQKSSSSPAPIAQLRSAEYFDTGPDAAQEKNRQAQITSLQKLTTDKVKTSTRKEIP
jgi:hypothetical protein